MPKRIIDIMPPAFAKATTGKPALKKDEVRPPRNLNFSKKILIAPFLIALGVLAYFTLSKAEISIWPKTEVFVSKAKLVTPGTLFEAEKTISGEFTSSGKKNIEQKTEGQIKIYNNYNSDQILVASTRLQAPLEKFVPSLTKEEKPWFRTVERVVIPAKSYADVKVIADSAGEKYNIRPSKFSIPGLVGTNQYTQIYGESLQEFQGGQKREVPQVLKDDLDQARNQLAEQGIVQNKTELLAKIPLPLEFLEDSLKTEILATSSSAKAGAEAEKFNYQVKIRSEVLAFDKAESAGFAKGTILSQAVEGKKNGIFLIDENSLKINYSIFSFDSKTKNLTLAVSSEARIYSDLNVLSLKEGLAGLSLAEAKFFLENQPEIQKSQIRLWPFWQRKIPQNIEKIKLELKL